VTGRDDNAGTPRRKLSMLRRQSRHNALAEAGLITVLVVAAVALVHVLEPRAEDRAQPTQLPQHVADLRDTILAAARSGDIDELKTAFDLSGAPPDLGIGGMNDPIRALEAESADGQGREILAALIEILSLPPATQPLGSDIENNLIYVWPYIAERPLDKLTPAEDVDLYRLVPPAKAAEMHEKKRWLWWRLVVAADGTWLTFKRSD
jgi:hypothetical protein